MQKQTWLPGGLNGYGQAAPIGEADWMGLAGAVPFADGQRPWLWQAETPADGLVQVCAAAEGCEIHYAEGEGPDYELQCWQLAMPLTASLGFAIAEAARQWVLAVGPEAAAERLGFERVC
jgi:hypothetical protein